MINDCGQFQICNIDDRCIILEIVKFLHFYFYLQYTSDQQGLHMGRCVGRDDRPGGGEGGRHRCARGGGGVEGGGHWTPSRYEVKYSSPDHTTMEKTLFKRRDLVKTVRQAVRERNKEFCKSGN